MWCTHCVEDLQVVWEPDQDYIACSGCGKLFEFPVSKSHPMTGKPKKFQEKKNKHPTDNMSSTSSKSHGHELKRKEKKHKHLTDSMSSKSSKSHSHELKRKLLQSKYGYEPYTDFHKNVLKKMEVHREQWQAKKQKKSSLHMSSL